MAEHTPTPWRVDPRHTCDIQNQSGTLELATTSEFVLDGGQTPHHPVVKANAEFIVLACNSHNALLEACKEALGAAPVDFSKTSLADKLRAAIALAEGKENAHE